MREGAPDDIPEDLRDVELDLDKPPYTSLLRRPGKVRTVLFLILPTFFLVVLAWFAMRIRVPTRMEVAVVTERLAFTVGDGGDASYPLINSSIAFDSLVVERCGEILLRPQSLELQVGSAAWSALETAGTVRFAGLDPVAAKATLDRVDEHGILGIFEPLEAEAGEELILEVTRGGGGEGEEITSELVLELENPRTLRPAIHDELLLKTEGVALVEGADVPWESAEFAIYKARLEESGKIVEITTHDHPVLILEPAPGASTDRLFAGRAIPVASVEVLREGLDGALDSPLVEETRLRYSDYPSIEQATLPPEELVGFHELGAFQLEGLSLDADLGALIARFDGVIGQAQTRHGEFSVDRRLTLFQTFRHGESWRILAVLAAWGLATSWLAYERWMKVAA